jgi:hypothetical protein
MILLLRGSLFVFIAVLSVWTANCAQASESIDASNFVNEMATKQQGAFVSGCYAHSSSARIRAAIVFFPRSNSGLFVVSDNKGAAFNLGRVELTAAGQWDLADLEGGTDTIRILSDLYEQITRMPFTWFNPKDVNKTLSWRPAQSCRLLGNLNLESRSR